VSGWVTRAARAILRRAAGKSVWGQAILAELDEVEGTWATLRWTAGGLLVSWRQRPTVARRLVAAAACATLAAVLTGQFLLGVRYMPSGSMEPTVHLSSRVVVDKLGFKLAGLNHGDLLLLHQTGVDGAPQTAVRRVIGLPGDRIECRDGVVFRNGQAVVEPYLAEGTRTECEPYLVPDERIYVLGDNRSADLDSRRTAPPSFGDLIGRVLMTF
jgi:signal peptidase I